MPSLSHRDRKPAASITYTGISTPEKASISDPAEPVFVPVGVPPDPGKPPFVPVGAEDVPRCRKAIRCQWLFLLIPEVPPGAMDVPSPGEESSLVDGMTGGPFLLELLRAWYELSLVAA